MTLFDDIVGFDDIKEALKKSITEDLGVHWILVGPPGSARSAIILDIEDKVDGAMFISGTDMSKQGIQHYIRTHLPKYLLIDELDKCGPATLHPLLNLCEHGRITSTTKYDPFDIKVDTVVFGTANNLDDFGEYFLDRFNILHFPPYTHEEFINVCKKILPRREKIGIRVAKYIGEKVWNDLESKSIRQAIRLARFCKTKYDVEWMVDLLKKYGEEVT